MHEHGGCGHSRSSGFSPPIQSVFSLQFLCVNNSLRCYPGVPIFSIGFRRWWLKAETVHTGDRHGPRNRVENEDTRWRTCGVALERSHFITNSQSCSPQEAGGNSRFKDTLVLLFTRRAEDKLM